MWLLPSFAVAWPVRVTVGPTLLTATVWVAVLLGALSESLTCTETVEDAGPSGNEQTKLPPAVVVVVVPTWEPLAPQKTATIVNVSVPASLTENP